MRTEHQKIVFDRAYNDEDKIVRFEGAGGTGKSYTINNNEYGYSFTITATTNKALTHHDNPFGTIHSFLGFTMVEGRLVKKKNHKQEIVDTLIVDESSMLNRQLMRSIENCIEFGFIKKVILVGDPIQLQIDPFLDLSRYKRFELTEQMRQTEKSALTRNLDRLRFLIESNGSPERLEYDNKCIRYENHKEFVEAYKRCSTNKYILSFKNNTVKLYNKKIVKDMHKKDDEYNVGDNLVSLGICNDENGKMLLRNREEFIVDNIVEFDNYWLINNNIKIPKTKTWLNEQIDKYKEVNWREYYKIKEQFVFAHHSYAGTVHSAQGSTYDDIFIDVLDFDVPNDPLSQTLLRLMYVGLSRARIRAHVFVGTERDWNAFKG